MDVGKLWRFARSIEDLMRRDKAHEEAVRKIVQRLDAIEGRLIRLEAQQGIVVAEAKGAAAATGAAAAAARARGSLVALVAVIALLAGLLSGALERFSIRLHRILRRRSSWRIPEASRSG